MAERGRTLQQWDPDDLAGSVTGGLENVDLKASAATKYGTGIMLMGPHFNIQQVVKVVNAGTAATVGEFKLTVKLYDKGDKLLINNTAIYEFDFATALDSKVTNDVLIIFAGGQAAAKRGTATLDADIDAFKVFQFVEFIIEVVTASDAGTSSVASLHMLADT